ncbi:MAG: carboxypeptidase-like regulatory domain-containing protein, partial [Terracidiphilus sp.]
MRRFFLLFVTLACAAVASAQIERANLTGTVTDPSGRVVRKAAISLHAVATGIDQIAQTNSAGDYNFSALPIGEYTLTVSAPDFAREVFSNLMLQVGETRTLNVSMRLSTVSSDVQVVAETPNLNMTSAEVSGIIQRSQLQDLPVNGR